MLTLVTGATGLLGNNVVRELLVRGQAVRVLVRESSNARSLAKLDVEHVVGAVTDREAVKRAVYGAGQIIHCAGHVHIGWGDIDAHRQINVEGTRNIAEAARAEGSKLVCVSSVNALGLGSKQKPATESHAEPGIIPCGYVVSKRESDEMIAREIEKGLRAVTVYPGFMLGPWDWKPSSGRLLLALATLFTPFYPLGGCSVADSRDVASGVLAAMNRAKVGSRYILAGANMSYKQIFDLMTSVTGAKGPTLPLGPVNRWIGGAWGDAYYRITGKEPEVNSATVRLSTQYHYFSSKRAEDELQYTVRAARETVESAWKWFCDYGYVPTPKLKKLRIPDWASY
jgi:dihydroflavonol-4-reductase